MARIHKEKHPRRTIVAIAFFMSASQLVVAQAPKGLNIDVESCVALEKPEERLACFEAQVEAARQRPAPASASDATRTNVGASVAGTAAGAGASTAAVAGASAAVGAGAVPGASAAAGSGATGAVERAPTSTGAAAPVVPSTAPAVQSQRSASEPRAIENFGLPEPTPERAKKPEPIEIVATVTELRQTVPNAYVITLDNGQVWRQVHPMPYPLRTGLEVRVHETGLGYRLTAPELHGQINVERVR